jgi:hypothetical protein
MLPLVTDLPRGTAPLWHRLLPRAGAEGQRASLSGRGAVHLNLVEFAQAAQDSRLKHLEQRVPGVD